MASHPNGDPCSSLRVGSLYLARKAAEKAGFPSPSYASLVIANVVTGILAAYHKVVSEKIFKEDHLITHITKENFKQEVLDSDIPVIMDVYSKSCPPCKAMAPIISELSKKMEGKVKFVALDAFANSTLAQSLKITHLPTFLFIKK